MLSGIYNVDKLITPHDEAVVRMGESRRFYSDLEVGQPGPRYDFVFSVAQGVDVVINGPVSKEVAIRQVEQALEDAVSEAPGTRVYFSGTFSSELALKVERLNKAAMAPCENMKLRRLCIWKNDLITEFNWQKSGDWWRLFHRYYLEC